MTKRTLDVCLSPALYHKYAAPDTIVIMVDAIRASAVICTAFMNGVKEIIPFSDKDKAFNMKKKGYVTAGERDGDTIPGFDYGNSPFHFSKENIGGKKLAFTTTNGTRALHTAAEAQIPAKQILVGSFLNISALSDYLEHKTSENVLVLCSGWKNTVNIEDSYFAGRLSQMLSRGGQFHLKEAANMVALYSSAFSDVPFETVMDLSPRLKKKSRSLEADFRYCMQEDLTKIIPVFKNGKLGIRY
jgi:2-phosphosulfolactate phosphatase